MELTRNEETIELSNIDDQSWTTLIADFMICPYCGIVDRDSSRSRIGEPCSACSEPSEYGLLYFTSPVFSLIRLLQQAYFSKTPDLLKTKSLMNLQGIATILLFCTLKDVLLECFLIKFLKARNIPVDIIEKLFEDNKLANQRFGGLFRSIVGRTWDGAVREVSNKEDYDFKMICEIMKLAVKARNDFLHKGRGTIDQQFATRCVNKLYDLMYLHVALHNLFIQPYILTKGNRSALRGLGGYNKKQ